MRPAVHDDAVVGVADAKPGGFIDADLPLRPHDDHPRVDVLGPVRLVINVLWGPRGIPPIASYGNQSYPRQGLEFFHMHPVHDNVSKAAHVTVVEHSVAHTEPGLALGFVSVDVDLGGPVHSRGGRLAVVGDDAGPGKFFVQCRDAKGAGGGDPPSGAGLFPVVGPSVLGVQDRQPADLEAVRPGQDDTRITARGVLPLQGLVGLVSVQVEREVQRRLSEPRAVELHRPPVADALLVNFGRVSRSAAPHVDERGVRLDVARGREEDRDVLLAALRRKAHNR